MLRNMLGPSFDSTFLTCLGHFPFSKYVETTIFRVFSAKMHVLTHPQNLGTLFVNTAALTDFCPLFLCFCSVRFFSPFLERDEKHKFKTKQPKKQDHKMQTRNKLSPVSKNDKIIQINCLKCFYFKHKKTNNNKNMKLRK